VRDLSEVAALLEVARPKLLPAPLHLMVDALFETECEVHRTNLGRARRNALPAGA